MRLIIQENDRKYLYIGLIILIICLSVSYQVRTASRHSEVIREKEKINTQQKDDIGNLEGSVEVLNTKAKKLMLEADSLQASEEKFKQNYYATDKKLKSTILSYDRSSDASKWRALSKAIRE
jgi:peptidoglycan hydrolase CwlO-like protein